MVGWLVGWFPLGNLEISSGEELAIHGRQSFGFRFYSMYNTRKKHISLQIKCQGFTRFCFWEIVGAVCMDGAGFERTFIVIRVYTVYIVLYELRESKVRHVFPLAILSKHANFPFFLLFR